MTTAQTVVAVGTTPTGTTPTADPPPIASDTTAAPPPSEVPVTTAPAPAPVVSTAASTPASPGFVFYLSSPGSGDVASQLVLPLSVESPPVVAPVPNYDTDRDNDAGLLLKHDSGSGSEQSFRWDIPQPVALGGAVVVELFATGKNNNGPFTLDVWLRSCRGSDCTDIAYGRQTSNSPDQGFASMTFDLGTIDTVLAAGDALELVIGAPTESGRHVWLAYDAAAAASRIVFVRS